MTKAQGRPPSGHPLTDGDLAGSCVCWQGSPGCWGCGGSPSPAWGRRGGVELGAAGADPPGPGRGHTGYKGEEKARCSLLI